MKLEYFLRLHSRRVGTVDTNSIFFVYLIILLQDLISRSVLKTSILKLFITFGFVTCSYISIVCKKFN